MSEKEIFKFEGPVLPEQKPVPETEKELTPEKIELLPDWEEPGSFYRGVTAQEAVGGILGKLRIDANPADDPVGRRDNACLNLQDAIYLSRQTSQTKYGRKFMCAIGFDPLPGAEIEPSFLGRSTFIRFTGTPNITEIVLRFAGKEPGKPGQARHFSPKEFYEWYQKNII